MKLYSIRDQVAEKFGPVFIANNDGVAVRQFGHLLKDVDYVGEYDLYLLADFNEESGSLKCEGTDDGFGTFSPQFVANGLDIKRHQDVIPEE